MINHQILIQLFIKINGRNKGNKINSNHAKLKKVIMKKISRLLFQTRNKITTQLNQH